MEKLNCNGLFMLSGDDVQPWQVSDEKTVLCGVPGAYTPGCNKHLPGFAKNMDKLKLIGIKNVVFMSVMDAFVLEAWNLQYGNPEIQMVSDPLAVFSKSINKDVDFGETFGIRCKRFALLIENGVIIKEYYNPWIEGVIEDYD